VEGELPTDWEIQTAHNYLRLVPECNQGTHVPADCAGRHGVLAGFDETDILPFGGTLEVVAAPDTQVLATYIPAYPIYPPEFSWMREPRTDVPAVVVHQNSSGGRVVYLAADVDRCYGRGRLPDHGDLLANAVRWAVRDELPLRVEGPGYLDCHLYRQGSRRIVHVVNLSGCRAWPDCVEEYLPVGPVRVAVRLRDDFSPSAAQCRVSGESPEVVIDKEWAVVEMPSVLAHELIVLE
jgi:hypothetical protein